MVEELFGHTEDVPDLYVDSVRVGTSLYTITLDVGIQGIPNAPGAEKPPTTPLAHIRMSPQHAKVLGMLIMKNIDLYEEKIGPIQIPPEVYKDIGVEPDD